MKQSSQQEFVAKSFGFEEGERLLFQSGYRAQTYRDFLGDLVPALSLNLIGWVVSVGLFVLSWITVSLYQSAGLPLNSPVVIVTIFSCGVYGCFTFYFLQHLFADSFYLTRGNLTFWFSRFLVTNRRVILITPNRAYYPLPPCSSRVFSGSIFVHSIADIEQVFLSEDQHTLKYGKIVLILKGGRPFVHRLVEIYGMEQQDAFADAVFKLLDKQPALWDDDLRP